MPDKHPFSLTEKDYQKIGRIIINEADLYDKPLTDEGYGKAGAMSVRVVTGALISKRKGE